MAKRRTFSPPEPTARTFFDKWTVEIFNLLKCITLRNFWAKIMWWKLNIDFRRSQFFENPGINCIRDGINVVLSLSGMTNHKLQLMFFDWKRFVGLGNWNLIFTCSIRLINHWLYNSSSSINKPGKRLKKKIISSMWWNCRGYICTLGKLSFQFRKKRSFFLCRRPSTRRSK